MTTAAQDTGIRLSPQEMPAAEASTKQKKLALVASKGGLDELYPILPPLPEPSVGMPGSSAPSTASTWSTRSVARR